MRAWGIHVGNVAASRDHGLSHRRLSSRVLADPAIKWMELRKQGKIKERETYEQYGETNRGIVIPQVPFGNAKVRTSFG